MIIIFNANDFKNKIDQYRYESDYEKIIELCGYMIRFGEKNNHYRALIESYFQRGVSYYNIGDIKNAFNDLMHKIKEELDQLALSLEIQHQVKEQHKRYKEIEEKNKMLELSKKKIVEQSKALESFYDQLWGKYYDKDSEAKKWLKKLLTLLETIKYI